MESKGFNFNEFIDNSKQALLKPEEYFSSMSTEGGLVTPLIKALIYGGVAGILNLIWSLLKIGAAGGMLGGALGGAVGILAFFWSIFAAVIGLFIGAVIILILVAIASGKTDFEPIVHVQASLMVIMPVSAFMNIFHGIHPVLGSLMGLAVNLYLLWMLFHAMTKTLGANVDTSKIIMFVLGGILILFFFIGLATRRAADRFIRDIQQYSNNEQVHIHKDNPFGEKTFTGYSRGFPAS